VFIASVAVISRHPYIGPRVRSFDMASISVEKLSLRELIALEAKLKSAIATARDRERADVRTKMAELAKTHGFSISELFGEMRGHGAKNKSVGIAKYANPEDKSDTWTGRGRKPNWLVARLKKGAKLSDFEI
jgi:DNA-binding protein H-NS